MAGIRHRGERGPVAGLQVVTPTSIVPSTMLECAVTRNRRCNQRNGTVHVCENMHALVSTGVVVAG